jgi:hypothetical protein
MPTQSHGIPFLNFLIVIPVASASTIGRQSEFRADLTAARLGYAPILIQVFHAWLAQGHDDNRKHQRLSDRVFQSHPALSKRIARLEKFDDTNSADPLPRSTAFSPAPTSTAPAITSRPEPKVAAASGFAGGAAAPNSAADNQPKIPPVVADDGFLPYPPVSDTATVLLYEVTSVWTDRQVATFTDLLAGKRVPSEMRDGALAVHPAAAGKVEEAIESVGFAQPIRRTL